jgi:ParB/RepB/Spo0J family partition protein
MGPGGVSGRPAEVVAIARSARRNADREVNPMEPRMIPIDRIRILEGHNARIELGDLSELAASIEEFGVLQSLLVTPLPAQEAAPVYALIAGERRLTAASLAGKTQVPCTVLEKDDARRRVAAMLAENMHKRPLAPLEEAGGMKRLADLGVSQREIARQLGCTQSHVSKRLTLLGLPKSIQGSIDQPRDAGGITVAEALELARLNDHPRLQAEAFAEGRRYFGGVTGAVKNQLVELEHERLRAAACSKLMADGTRILKERGWYDWTTMVERPLLGQRQDHSAVRMTVEAHQAEPCHAAAVGREGTVTYVCTDPTRHGEADPGSAARAEEARQHAQQQRLENRIRREAAHGRREAMERALAAANTGNLTFAATQITSHWRLAESELACALLGLEPIVEKNECRTYKSYQATLGAYAGTSMTAAIRAMLALALACGEATVASTWGGVTELSRRHVQQLVALGYEPNESDRKHLAGESGPADPTAEGDEERECRLCGDLDGDLRGDGRRWVEDPQEIGDLCSACLERITEASPGGQAAAS